jgi:quinol monooxygenase YgiN
MIRVLREEESVMITVLFHMTVKPENEGRVETVAKELTASTKAEDRGCVEYRFYRRADQTRQLLLFE